MQPYKHAQQYCNSGDRNGRANSSTFNWKFTRKPINEFYLIKFENKFKFRQ